MLTKYFAQRKFSLDSFEHSNFKHSQLITLVIALFIVGISLAFHELWQDELEAPARIHNHSWNIGALINSFRGDGHFPPYHLLVYPFLFIGNRLLGIDVEPIIKFVTFIQYFALALMTIRWIRFPLSLLFLLSYYPLFEFGTISRCYLLELILLLIIFRSILLKNQVNQYLTLFACFLFPITDLVCFVYSLPLLIYCIVRKHWLKVSAFVASYPIAVFFLLPSSEHSYAFAAKEYPSPLQFIQNFIRFTISAWVPFTTDTTVWWNQSLAAKLDIFSILFTVAIVVLIGITLIRLYAFDPLLLIACGCSSGAVIAALVLKYPLGAFRHIGFASWPFLCVLVLLYSRSEPRVVTNLNGLQWFKPIQFNSAQVSLDRLTRLAFAVVLVLQCLFGLVAVHKDVNSVFSFSAAQVQVLRQLHETVKNPQRLVLLDYPSGGSMAVMALSNWQFNIAPVWSLASRGCLPTESETPPEKSACPKNIVVTTWAAPLQGFDRNTTKLFDYADKSFRESLLETFYGRSVGAFLKERSYRCREIAGFTGSQTVNGYTYRCRQKRSTS